MRIERKTKDPKILNQTILLPIATIAIVGVLFFISSAYKPNWTFDWMDIRPEIRDTVLLIEDYGSITSGIVGIQGKTPQQWPRRRWFFKNAKEHELRKLIDYPNGVVKATAYEGLIRKPNTNSYELILQALNDTTTFFNYQSGCVGYPMMIGKHLVQNLLFLTNRGPLLTKRMKILGLSEKEVLDIKELYQKRMAKNEFY